MDITLIAIALLVFIALLFLLLYFFNSINKKSFKADDGTIFASQADLDVYQSLYKKTQAFFSIEDNKGSTEAILGFEKSFLTKLTSEGFSDLRSLIKYRKQIKSLSDLINT